MIQASVQNLAKLGLTKADINCVLLTHMHGDHIGGLLKDGKIAFPNADIYLAERELEYWQDKEAFQTLAPYGNKIKTFLPNELGQHNTALLPSLYPIAAYGHTPGHTMFLVQNGGQELLIWGDLTHVMPLQMPEPWVAVTYDVNPAEAVKTRQAVLQYASQNNILIAGIHIPSPSLGWVNSVGAGYQFLPALLK